MKRKIVKIDEAKCNGCGLCIEACHEGALQLVNGKARLVSEAYCDGLGDCLPECPVGAITIAEREAAVFDQSAVARNLVPPCSTGVGHSCPGSQIRIREEKAASAPQTATPAAPLRSELKQWPCQIKLAPVNAPFFDGADLLIAADCTAFAYANLHQDYMQGHVTLIGCPKLDDTDYSEKLGAIFQAHDLNSVTVLRMEVPCCGGLVNAVKQAMLKSGKLVPWQVVTITVDGLAKP